MGQVRDLADQHRVDAILDGGDFFHVKDPARNSHRLVGEVAEAHRKFPCPVYCIPGNHDITSNDLSTVDKQPLGVLFRTGVFRPLTEAVFQKPGTKVTVHGYPYVTSRSGEWLRARDGFTIAVIHALAAENPAPGLDELFNEPVLRYSDLVRAGGPDLFAFGHWHRDQGIVNLQGRTFINTGAASRGALSHENLKRQPKVVLIEVDGTDVACTPIPLELPPPETVFDLERKARDDRVQVELDRLVRACAEGVRSVKATIGSEQESPSFESLLEAMDLSAEVRAVVAEHLDRAGG